MAPHGTAKARTRSSGRTKIEIKKIEDQARRHVTFSKRRTGLFNKASELCVLCAADIAVIAQSPGNKVFSFGHPSPDAVIHRYLSSSSSFDAGGGRGHRKAAIEAREVYADAKRAIDVEQGSEEVVGIWQEMADGEKFLWELSVEAMGMEELDQFVQSLEEMRGGVMEILSGSNGGRAVVSSSPESEIAAELLSLPVLGRVE